jgi:hypothetical protein
LRLALGHRFLMIAAAIILACALSCYLGRAVG